MPVRMIVSPAKKMNVVDAEPRPTALPTFVDEAARILHELRRMDLAQCQELWKCSDRLARENFGRLQAMDLAGSLTAACVAYEGIQYQHIAAAVMDEDELSWLQEHLRILSGFYGVVRPLDGVAPYRLEMQARLSVGGCKNLYEYWESRLYDLLAAECGSDGAIVNLASKEYARAVLPHSVPGGPRIVTCLFGTPRGELGLVQRATEAKAARGTFVRWCCERRVEDVAELPAFAERGYSFDERRSDTDTLVFVRA